MGNSVDWVNDVLYSSGRLGHPEIVSYQTLKHRVYSDIFGLRAPQFLPHTRGG